MNETSIRLELLGHAGMVVRAGGISILVDPWFYPAFLESWFPWPDNRYLLPEVDGQHFDFVYISHVHEDHLDRRTLARIDPQTVVLCPSFRSKSVQRELAKVGFAELTLLSHGEEAELGPGVSATMLLDTSHKEDSALMIEAGGFRFLDLNDCHLRLNEMPRNVDLLAAQFSGAMWYPNRYDYTAGEMGKKVSQVRENLLDTLGRTALACDARRYLPFAGPPCFLAPELSAYNDSHGTIFYRWDDAAESFATACPEVGVVPAGPGDTVRCESGEVQVERRSQDHARSHAAPELGAYRDARQEEWDIDRSCSVVTTEELRGYLTSLERKNRQLMQGFTKRILIVSGPQRWSIRLGPYPELEVEEGDGVERPEYTFRVPGWVLRKIVDQEVTWEDALLSMRVGLARDPDVFDMTLLGLLRYGTQPVQTQQMVADREQPTELIVCAGWRFQRYCPHAGEDLTLATIRDGTLECPRHHWRWNLATGDCLEGGTLPLRVEREPSDDPA